MPTVFENKNGFRYFFVSLDCGEPIHIHVGQGRKYAKFWHGSNAGNTLLGEHTPLACPVRRLAERNPEGKISEPPILARGPRALPTEIRTESVTPHRDFLNHAELFVRLNRQLWRQGRCTLQAAARPLDLAMERWEERLPMGSGGVHF